ncbi:hypothetical protein SCLCIDRAFT_434538 [Scleroderma citrinum Foug A]|uniref:Uncharacterized protein n=1 Tax=Scleroderma citrinum Foug A TaxID=1036808 RepID=A0A0C3DAV8_9AGAM|nr:hypothetical protein SCLCIDRAFT_434538 [Scleroderma citrinum Foug A]
MTNYLIQTVPDGLYLGYAPDSHRPGGGIPPPPQPIVVLPKGTRATKFGIVQYDDGTYGVDFAVNKDGRLFHWIVSPQHWKITFRPTHDAFTIEEANGHGAWTTPANRNGELQIHVQPLPHVSEEDLPQNVLFKLVTA